MMKALGTVAVVFAAVACVSFAAGLPARSLTGNYMEARTADVYTGPCFANGETEMNGKEAVLGWKVKNGNWHGVSLDGLGVVGVIRAKHTLGDVSRPVNPVTAVLIVDSRANSAQREALVSFAKSQSGELLQNVVKVQYAPVELTVQDGNIHGGAARLTAGSLALIQTRGLNAGDVHCGNEEIWYPPLAKLDHVMPAFALENSYQGEGLGQKWNGRLQRSGFIGTFQAAE